MNPETYRLLYEDEHGEVVGLDELQYPDMAVPSRVPALRRLLSGADGYVAFQAAQLLAAWGDDAGLEHLARVARDWARAGADSGPDYYSHRIWDYDNTGDYIAEAVARYVTFGGGSPAHALPVYRDLLSLYGLAEFESRLAHALLQPPGDLLLPEVDEAVRRSLALGKSDLASRLLPVVARWRRGAALAVLGQFAAPGSTPLVRVDVARALAYLPSEMAVPRLERFAVDPDVRVAQQARQSLYVLLVPDD